MEPGTSCDHGTPANVSLMIDARQRELIRATFELIRQDKQRAGQLFYEELFALAPEVEEMFAGVSIMAQGGKLMQMLEWAVDHLEDPVASRSQLEQLGERHVGYQVRTDHYAAVGSALLRTVKKLVGPDLFEEAEDAWVEFYTYLSMTMEKGARAPSAQST